MRIIALFRTTTSLDSMGLLLLPFKIQHITCDIQNGLFQTPELRA
jgi:hypothetical protein